MKRLLCLALACCLTACAPEPGNGGSLQLEQLRGRWVVVNYWAQWCKPCIREIPELNALNEAYPEVAVFGVNFDGADGEELARQVAQLGVAFPTLVTDPAAQLGLPRPVVLPTTLVLDPTGRLTDTLVGPQTLESLALATRQSPTPVE